MRVKQIAIEPATTDAPAVMWAVCKDGSLWMRELGGGDGAWLRIPAPKETLPAGSKETDTTPPPFLRRKPLNGEGDIAQPASN